MQDWIVDLKERSMQPVLANPGKQVMRLLNNANLTPLLGAFIDPCKPLVYNLATPVLLMCMLLEEHVDVEQRRGLGVLMVMFGI